MPEERARPLRRSPAAPARALQAAVVLVGAAALAFLLLEPLVEGRNAQATLFATYFKDPFLAFVYLGSVPFFVALRQAFTALGLVGRGEAASPRVEAALRTIKVCALAVIGFVAVGEVVIVTSGSDDHAGGVMMGLLVASGAAVAATAAALFERVHRDAVAKRRP
ncbi:MAG: DUF2975 domain-containing protein [Elusimicrobiota bacterium]|nr:DUF2975 domain-containing protein [Elusimicrobiota bacterium]